MTGFKHLSISRQVLFAFGALCLVLVTIGALFLFSLRAIEHRRQTQQAKAHYKWEVADEVAKSLGVMQSEILQHVLATDAGEMKRRDEIILELERKNTRILRNYEALIDNDQELDLYAHLQQTRTAYLEQTRELLALSRALQNAEAEVVALTRQSPTFAEYHGVVDELLDEAEENARQARADTSQLIGKLGRNGGILIGLAMLITLGTAYTVVKVTRRLRADNETLIKEIIERKRAEEEREKFFALIENSADFIGMATLEGTPLYLNKAGREMVGLDLKIDVSLTNIPEYFTDETAALLRNIGIPATLATGGWAGEGNLRHFTSRTSIPVHMHSILVKDPKTGRPICLATIQRNISDIKEAEKKLEKAHRDLIDVSRLSGMAEIATSVLHNVGNVLNSVNVSAERVAEKVKGLRPASLPRVAALLREHSNDLPEFLSRDSQGKELPGYLSALVEQLADPHKDILPEVSSLRKNIEHIREIVRMQQSYARVSGVLETMPLAGLVEDAIRINAAGLTRHSVQLIREFSPVPSFPIDKHKVLQILVNLLNNAKYALDARNGADSKLIIRVALNGGDTAKVSVIDNGVGIAPENLTRIFQRGFTTRKNGHGFGLHSGALAAKELGGSLTAHSDGLGLGAVFTLELPCATEKSSSE